MLFFTALIFDVMVGIHYGFSTNFYFRNFVSETLFLKMFPIHYRNKVSEIKFQKLYFQNFSTIHYRNIISEIKFRKQSDSVSSTVSKIKFRKLYFRTRTGSTSKTLFPKLFSKTNHMLHIH